MKPDVNSVKAHPSTVDEPQLSCQGHPANGALLGVALSGRFYVPTYILFGWNFTTWRGKKKGAANPTKVSFFGKKWCKVALS